MTQAGALLEVLAKNGTIAKNSPLATDNLHEKSTPS